MTPPIPLEALYSIELIDSATNGSSGGTGGNFIFNLHISIYYYFT